MQARLNAGNSLIKAFTIIEIMTVIIIISLLVTAAIPGYDNFVRNNEANIMASRLESSLRLAQAAAIKNGIPVTICPISNAFDPSSAPSQTTDEWPCQNITAWDAWKVMLDPKMNAIEDFSNGWPVLQYVGDNQLNAISSNIAGPITFDAMGFVNLNPSVTRAGWTWTSSYSSGEWSWSYTYGSAYTGAYTDRVFTITPSGCTGENARAVQVTQNGVISTTNITCY